MFSEIKLMTVSFLKPLGVAVSLIGSSCLGQALAQDQSDALTLEYMVLDQGVPEFLALLAHDAGRRVNVSKVVSGQITKLHLEGSVEEVISQLSIAYDLDWFSFNDVTYVSSKKEATSRMVRLGYLPIETAREALFDLGLPFDRYGIRDAAQGTALALSGPPQLLGFAEATIESLPDATDPPQVAQAMVRVRRGNTMTLEPIMGGAVSEYGSATALPLADDKEAGN